MRTNTVIIGLVLAVALIAGGALIYFVLSDNETIYVEITMQKGKEPRYVEYGGNYAVVIDCYVTYTSSEGKDGIAYSVPDMVLKSYTQERRLQASPSSTYFVPGPNNPYHYKSGEALSTRISYSLGSPIDLSKYDVSYTLSHQMEVAGNYKLIEQ